jgi:hypothetical protein
MDDLRGDWAAQVNRSRLLAARSSVATRCRSSFEATAQERGLLALLFETESLPKLARDYVVF